MSTQTVFLHQALAQTFGLNATDTKCIDLVLCAPGGTLAAGQLSEMSGLTTGAVTHILDRLEKKGFIERRRDPGDRRKVLVQVKMESLAAMTPHYEEIGHAFMAVSEKYDDSALKVICDYMEETNRVSEQELIRLVTAARARGAKE